MVLRQGSELIRRVTTNVKSIPHRTYVSKPHPFVPLPESQQSRIPVTPPPSAQSATVPSVAEESKQEAIEFDYRSALAAFLGGAAVTGFGYYFVHQDVWNSRIAVLKSADMYAEPQPPSEPAAATGDEFDKQLERKLVRRWNYLVGGLYDGIVKTVYTVQDFFR
mmetsp:Transcript_14423/g.23980  ORF Transcript_14423/g.23980 Transcript_14423/m.23980 type:complete len:164 (+) Transcript_14423:31-522(+)